MYPEYCIFLEVSPIGAMALTFKAGSGMTRGPTSGPGSGVSTVPSPCHWARSLVTAGCLLLVAGASLSVLAVPANAANVESDGNLRDDSSNSGSPGPRLPQRLLAGPIHLPFPTQGQITATIRQTGGSPEGLVTRQQFKGMDVKNWSRER